MTTKVEKIKFTLHQTRYIEVEISAEKGYTMPTTIEEVISYSDSIRDNPTMFIEKHEECNWIVDEDDIQNLEWIEKE